MIMMRGAGVSLRCRCFARCVDVSMCYHCILRAAPSYARCAAYSETIEILSKMSEAMREM